MGCFNGEGCISGLPIEAGDPIGGLICFCSYDYEQNEMITPIWPILWGEYNDYGGIELNSKDYELEEYFGNREDLLHDLERITHGCRHQIKEGLPQDICLLLEHKEVLDTLIAFGQPALIKYRYQAGGLRYQLELKPAEYWSENKNIYSLSYSYRDNGAFLICFRKFYKNNLPANRSESYFETMALYETLIANNIYLKWQRFAGWQEPGRDSSIWKNLVAVYQKLTK